MAKSANDSIISMSGEFRLGLDTRDFDKVWQNKSAKMAEKFSEITKKAVDEGFGPRNLRKFADAVGDISDRLLEGHVKAQSISAKMASENLTKQEKALLEMDLAHAVRSNKALGNQMAAEMRNNSNRADALEAYNKKMKEGLGAASEEFAENIGSAFEDLKSGKIGGLLKSLGKGTQTAGNVMQGKAGDGPMGAMANMMGGILKSVGPALLAIGALVGGVAALAKILIDADSKAKELNKAILDGSTTAGDLVGKTGDLGEALQVVRKATTDFSFNRVWGTLAKDQIEIIGGFMAAGVSVRDLTKDLANQEDQVKALQEADAKVLVLAKTLGKTGAEMAEMMGTDVKELGLTLDGVRNRFDSVYDAAVDSGFGVKRFFAQVLQATSGMTMYNVRLEQAAGMLVHLGKILGQQKGGEFLKELAGTLDGEGYQDRFKRLKMTGQDRAARTYRASANDAGNNFVKDLDKSEGGEGMKAALKAAGLVNKDGSAMGGQALVKGLGSMSTAKREALVADAQLKAGSALSIQLQNLADKARGATGSMAAMSIHMDTLDMSGKLQMMLDQAKDMPGFKGKEFHEILGEGGIEKLMGLSSTRGLDPSKIKEIARISEKTSGGYKAAKALADANGGKGDESQNDALAKEFGLIIRDGKILGAKKDGDGGYTTGKPGEEHEVKSKEDYVRTLGAELAGIFKAKEDPSIALAQDQIRATTDVSLLLEQGVEAILEKIYESTSGMLDFLIGPLVKALSFLIDDDKDNKTFYGIAAKVQRDTEARKGQNEASAAYKKADRAVQNLTKKAADPNATEADREALVKAEGERETARLELKRAKKYQEGVQGMTGDELAKKKAAMMAQAKNDKQDEAQEAYQKAVKEEAANTDKSKTDELAKNRQHAAKAVQEALLYKPEDDSRFTDEKVVRAGMNDASTAASADVQKEVQEKADVKNLAAQKKLDVAAANKKKKEEEALAKGAAAKAIADEIAKKDAKKELTAALMDKLHLSDKEARAASKALMEGKNPSADVQAKLKGKAGEILGATPSLEDAPTLDKIQSYNDVVAHIGADGRIKSAYELSSMDDTSLVSNKPDGTLANVARGARGRGGSGGGTTVVHQHFYNDGKGNFHAVKQALEDLI